MLLDPRGKILSKKIRGSEWKVAEMQTNLPDFYPHQNWGLRHWFLFVNFDDLDEPLLLEPFEISKLRNIQPDNVINTSPSPKNFQEHSSPSSFYCVICKKKYSSESTWKTHLKSTPHLKAAEENSKSPKNQISPGKMKSPSPMKSEAFEENIRNLTLAKSLISKQPNRALKLFLQCGKGNDILRVTSQYQM